MASIEYGVRDIYAEITEYCDKSIEKFNRRTNRIVWKNRARIKREAQKVKEDRFR